MYEILRRTYRKVVSMLKEDTGISILDSGDYYGRHWQINQKKDFLKEEPYKLHVTECEYCRGLSGKNGHGCSEEVCMKPFVDITVSLFWYLMSNVEYTEKAEELEKKFYRFVRKQDPDDEWTWNECFDAFKEAYGLKVKAPLENTYSIDGYSLSQCALWAEFDIDNDSFVWMQIHNGCDIRGGYTRPGIFEVPFYKDGLFYDTDYFEFEFDNGSFEEFCVLEGIPEGIYYDKVEGRLFIWDGDSRSYLREIYGGGFSWEVLYLTKEAIGKDSE